MSDKTEEPTPRRLRKAREEGDSGVSSFAAQSLAFAVAVAIAPTAVRTLATHAEADVRAAIAQIALHPDGLVAWDPRGLALECVVLVVPILAAVGVAGAFGHALQTRGFVSAKRLTPQLARLNPANGIASLFSASRVFSVARSLVAGALVALFARDALVGHAADFARLARHPTAVASVIGAVAGGLAWRAAVLGMMLGGADVLITRRTWLRRLRMTKDEVRREHRDAEGDPHLKAARLQAHQEMLAQATIANVRNASVVVVNPTHLASALRYDGAIDDAPRVVAQGEGDSAARIVRVARQALVPVVEDVPLARALHELAVGDAIPEVLYEAVAAILRELGSAPRPG